MVPGVFQIRGNESLPSYLNKITIHIHQLTTVVIQIHGSHLGISVASVLWAHLALAIGRHLVFVHVGAPTLQPVVGLHPSTVIVLSLL